MRLHRFIGTFDLSGKELAINDLKVIHQMTKVLRLQVGDQVILGNGQGIETIGDIRKIGRDTILMTLREKVRKSEESLPKVSLYLAILKKENFELVVQKVTEIGVSEIIPLKTARTIKQNLNEKRITKIMCEAAEQSGRGVVPVLLPTMSPKDALARSANSEARWFLDERGKSSDRNQESVKIISIFVGPEGGWTDEERLAAQTSGCSILKISFFTLRAETAAIAGVFLAEN